MEFRVAGNCNMEVAGKFPPDEINQFIRMLKRARTGQTFRSIPAQHHQPLHASLAVIIQQAEQRFTTLNHAGNVGGDWHTCVSQQRPDCFPGRIERRPAGAESHRQVMRLESRQLLPCGFKD